MIRVYAIKNGKNICEFSVPAWALEKLSLHDAAEAVFAIIFPHTSTWGVTFRRKS